MLRLYLFKITKSKYKKTNLKVTSFKSVLVLALTGNCYTVITKIKKLFSSGKLLFKVQGSLSLIKLLSHSNEA